MPTELFVPRLGQFDVSENDLNGTLPSEIGMAESLGVFSVGENNLSGSIPSEFGLLTNLRQVSFGGNHLSGEIPFALELLALSGNLAALNLTGNSISGTLSNAFCEIGRDSTCSFQPLYTIMPCTLDFDCSPLLCGYDCPCRDD